MGGENYTGSPKRGVGPEWDKSNLGGREEEVHRQKWVAALKSRQPNKIRGGKKKKGGQTISRKKKTGREKKGHYEIFAGEQKAAFRGLARSKKEKQENLLLWL